MSRARGLTLLALLYSATQHYRQPLDGDVGAIVLPSTAYTPVLHDPFGLGVLQSQQGQVGTNRFFAHSTQLAYSRTVPGWLQSMVSPISSVYLACALLKTAVQALLLFLLAKYAGLLRTSVPGSQQAGSGVGSFRLAPALLAPLFQKAGY